MNHRIQEELSRQLADIRTAGTWKAERILSTPQGIRVRVGTGEPVLNLCANNYLGLAQHPEVRQAARAALDEWGYGLASVRFICGTQALHKQLEESLAQFLGTEDTILYSSCWDANGGLFETLLTADDAILSDELNHASIIDGIRLCKARRYRYRNNDMADLEAKLRESEADARFRLVATDGVFSMDGTVAPLRAICDLADRYDAMVMVDDSHAVGFIGQAGAAPRAPRCDGSNRHPDRDARQGAGWCQWRIHKRPTSDHRTLASTVAALPVLQHRRAPGGRRRPEGDRTPVRLHGTAGSSGVQHAALSRGLTRLGFDVMPGFTRLFRSCLATRRSRDGLPKPCCNGGCTSLVFPTR
jgi:hypothetical protein